MKKKVNALNTSLKAFCESNGIEMINNENMDKSNLGQRKLHLNRKGNGILAKNIINCINNATALNYFYFLIFSPLLLCIFHLMQQVWRWLHEKKNGIRLDDRPQLLGMIKVILYTRNLEEIEDIIDELRPHVLLELYQNAGRYFENVLDLKDAWSLAQPSDLMLRENHTNNYVKSQFLVIKDEILKRVKEYNVIGLINKICYDRDYHYKTNMLSLSDGSFDGIYSSRFKGLLKRLPTPAELDRTAVGVIVLGNEIFSVPSFSNEGQTYLVDMNVSRCQCIQGQNGAPCKHQFLLWSLNFSSVSLNFMPVFFYFFLYIQNTNLQKLKGQYKTQYLTVEQPTGEGLHTN